MENEIDKSRIFLGYDSNFFQRGIKTALNWDYVHNAHLLVFGGTGSGKTYFTKLLLARIGLHLPEAVVTVCDFKADDFKFLSDIPNYHGFMECKEGFDKFFDMFTARQSGEDECRDFRLIVFDEWASYLNMLDKKETETAKSKLATLLMLGRSFNIHVLISQQRADSQYFSTARDNFSVIVALGNISKESKQMFFSGFEKEEMPPVTQLGEGYVLTNGAILKKLITPTVRNEKKLNFYIGKALSDK